jgi:hypothetical protein
VRLGRFELPTSCFGGTRSIHLSYSRTPTFIPRIQGRTLLADFRSTPHQGRKQGALRLPWARFTPSYSSFRSHFQNCRTASLRQSLSAPRHLRHSALYIYFR